MRGIKRMTVKKKKRKVLCLDGAGRLRRQGSAPGWSERECDHAGWVVTLEM